MRRVAVYGRDTDGKKSIVTELGSLKRYKFVESNSSLHSFLLFNDNHEPPCHTASLQILVLDLNNETTESIASLKKNYHPCDFKRPVLLMVYGNNKPLVEQLSSYLNSNVSLYHIEDMEKVNSEAILTQLDMLSSQFYDSKNNPVFNT
ncbi:hypothetical protein GH742_08025 [Legionella sp. MW5194]|uniref:hypothetical protein n=1 Tax=Legionella sp. MW5194 TaxID=2662448 RepID=UPI00193D8846|nr:hypothetical protein [Legionella sp. MW5194]QRN03825.1 hypothetical protein GH742_08025 [Legionella sp. MW5194]